MDGFLFVLSIPVGATLTLFHLRFARSRGIVARPNPIVPQHTCPVAHLGGLAIALAVLIMAPAAWAVTGAWLSTWSFALGGALFVLLGLADDVRSFRPLPKLLLQIAVATVVVVSAPVSFLTGNAAVDGALAVLWYMTVVNAANFTDVCDGLLGGLMAVTMIVCGSAFPADRSLAWVLAGANLGFLAFGRPPARIYLGDAGSHFLGFAAAYLVLQGVAGLPWWPALPVMATLLAVPLFEFAFITAIRIRKRLPWWKGSPDHFSLRMQAAGFSRWETDLCAWTAAGIAGCASWVLLHANIGLQIGTLAVLLVVAVLCWRRLSRWEVTRPEAT